jgi:hypothetical protein
LRRPAAAKPETDMTALYMILGFIAVVGLLNLVEFGRLD